MGRRLGQAASGRGKFWCACGEKRRAEFRESEPYRCRACRRAYNAQRKRQLQRELRWRGQL